MSDPFDPRPDSSPGAAGRAAADARAAADRLKAEGRQAVEGAQREASTLAAEARGTAEELKAQGQQAVEGAKRQAASLAEEGRQAGAERADDVARAVHAAAGELEQGSPEIAATIHRTAQAIEGFARDLRDRPAAEMLQGLQDFARRQPIAFLGATAIAGFALARFAKASAEDHAPHRPGPGTAPRRARTHQAVGEDISGGTAIPPAPTGAAAPPGWTGGQARPGGASAPTPRPAAPPAGTPQDPSAATPAPAAPGWVQAEDGTARPATRAAATLGGAAAQGPGGATHGKPQS